jgi:hypothetical protein
MEIKGYHFPFRKKPDLPGYLAIIASISIKCGAAFWFFDSGQNPLRFIPDFCARALTIPEIPHIRVFPHHRFKNVFFIIIGSYHGQG